MKNEKLTFTCGEGGEAEEFFVVEQTRLNGVTYLLVADSEEDDAECLILKDTSAPEEKDSVYEMVEEEVELNAVLKVFEELLEDEVLCTLRFIKEDGLELPARVTFFQGLPKADNIALVAERNGLRRPLYIGDTQGDYDAASKAGVPFLHAAYGFGRIDRPVPSVATFGDLPDAIRRLTPP